MSQTAQTENLFAADGTVYQSAEQAAQIVSGLVARGLGRDSQGREYRIGQRPSDPRIVDVVAVMPQDMDELDKVAERHMFAIQDAQFALLGAGEGE